MAEKGLTKVLDYDAIDIDMGEKPLLEAIETLGQGEDELKFNKTNIKWLEPGREVFTTSGFWTAPFSGNIEVFVVNGGAAGGDGRYNGKSTYRGWGGNGGVAGATGTFSLKVTKGEQYKIIIGNYSGGRSYFGSNTSPDIYGASGGSGGTASRASNQYSTTNATSGGAGAYAFGDKTETRYGGGGGGGGGGSGSVDYNGTMHVGSNASGGAGGGGTGGYKNYGGSATANTGGGGGGGAGQDRSKTFGTRFAYGGGSGASGIVLIRWKKQKIKS